MPTGNESDGSDQGQQDGDQRTTVPTAAEAFSSTNPSSGNHQIPVQVHLTVNIYVLDDQTNAPSHVTPTAQLDLNHILPEIVQRSGVLETALHLLAENRATIPEPAPTSTYTSTPGTMTREAQRNLEESPVAILHPERFGFVPVDANASHDDPNTLYWRQEHHPDSGSAADSSFSGPYTRDEVLRIIAEQSNSE